MQNKKPFVDPFLKILPTLDVHGETGDTVTLVVSDFINYNYALGKLKIAVIHGRNGNVLRTSIHNMLKTNKKVTKYYIYNFNDGITIIELKPKVEFL